MMGIPAPLFLWLQVLLLLLLLITNMTISASAAAAAADNYCFLVPVVIGTSGISRQYRRFQFVILLHHQQLMKSSFSHTLARPFFKSSFASARSATTDLTSISDIAETWLKISQMPYRFEITGKDIKIIIEHDMENTLI
jgi:hypothetical protein